MFKLSNITNVPRATPQSASASTTMRTMQSPKDNSDQLHATTQLAPSVVRRLGHSLSSALAELASDPALSYHRAEFDEMVKSIKLEEDEREPLVFDTLSLEDETSLPSAREAIADKYQIDPRTVQTFIDKFSGGFEPCDFMRVITSAAEFDQLSVRPGEQSKLASLVDKFRRRERLGDTSNLQDPHVKANVLLHAHLHRLPLSDPQLQHDLNAVLGVVIRLVHACVDLLVAANDSFQPALMAMQFAPMFTQAMWLGESDLMQLPHFTRGMIDKCREKKCIMVCNVLGRLSELELGLSEGQREDLGRFLMSFSKINFHLELDPNSRSIVEPLASVGVTLLLERRNPTVSVWAPLFPHEREEIWWLALSSGDDDSHDKLHCIKRFSLKQLAPGKIAKVTLTFTAPAQPSAYNYQALLLSDSYFGVNKCTTFTINVRSPI